MASASDNPTPTETKADEAHAATSDPSERVDRDERHKRVERDDRDEQRESGDPNAQRAEKSEKSEQRENAEHAEHEEPAEKPEKSERVKRAERSEKSERAERGAGSNSSSSSSSMSRHWLFDIDSISFSGGGVRTFAFCGVLAALEQLYTLMFGKTFVTQIKAASGASAGALYALMTVLGMSAEHVFDHIAGTDFVTLLNGFDLLRFPETYGLVPNTVMLPHIHGILQKAGFSSKVTFLQLYTATHRKLYVSVTNMNTLQYEFWSHETVPDMSVADAIVTSMSMPVLFTPTTITTSDHANANAKHSTGTGGIKMHAPGHHTKDGSGGGEPYYYCDGGVLMNVPFTMMDMDKTLVLRLERRDPLAISGWHDYLLRTLMCASDHVEKLVLSQIPEDKRDHVVSIDTGTTKSIDFAMDMAKKCAMTSSGMLQFVLILKKQEILSTQRWNELLFGVMTRYHLLLKRWAPTHSVNIVGAGVPAVPAVPAALTSQPASQPASQQAHQQAPHQTTTTRQTQGDEPTTAAGLDGSLSISTAPPPAREAAKSQSKPKTESLLSPLPSSSKDPKTALPTPASKGLP